MISGIVCFPSALLNDESFSITAAAPCVWIYIILPIATLWKAPLSILKLAPADVARERRAVSLVQPLQQIVDFLWSCPERRRRIG
jgi:hypothetical protein